MALAPVETFSIHEIFGVAHPPQIIDFDFSKRIDTARSLMIGPGGTEVPFQLLHDGKIAVEAALPPIRPRLSLDAVDTGPPAATIFQSACGAMKRRRITK